MRNSRKYTARWTVLLATGAALVGVVGATVPAAAAPTAPARAVGRHHTPLDGAALRASIGGMPDRIVTGALVQVSGRDGRWTGTAGPSVPSSDAHVRVGSITKLFTSTIALQLVGEGRLRMNSTVREVLPGVLPDAYEHDITLEQLLSHTSGIPQPSCVVEGPPRKVVADALECSRPSTPGESAQYNGINYFITGLMIEKVTGRPYERELQARILRPLGLRDTSLPDADDRSMPAPFARAAVARTPDATELTDISEATSPWPWAEGGMISNAPDLRRFHTALMRGRLLAPAQQKALFEVPAVPGARWSKGGLMRAELDNGVEVWGKTGSYGGYTNGVFATRDLDRVLVYSMNPTGRAPGIGERSEMDRIMSIANAAFQEAF